MKLVVTLHLTDLNGSIHEFELSTFPYKIGRKGFCECGNLQGKDISGVHCAIDADPEVEPDTDTYSGLSVVHIGADTRTIVDDCEITAREWVSLRWGEWYSIKVGQYLLEVYIEKPTKRSRRGSPPQPGNKKAHRGKGRVKGRSFDSDQTPSLTKNRGRGHHRK